MAKRALAAFSTGYDLGQQNAYGRCTYLVAAARQRGDILTADGLIEGYKAAA